MGPAVTVLRLSRKELRDVIREKSLVVAFLVQLFLAGFSTILLTGLMALYSPEAAAQGPQGAVAYAGPAGPGGFDRHLAEAPGLTVERASAEEAMALFRAGDVLAVVEESVDDAGVHTVTLVLPDGEVQSTLLVTRLRGLLEEYEEELREQRQGRLEQQFLTVEQPPRPSRPYGFVFGTLLPLLVLTPVFLSGAIAGDALSQEARSRTLLLLRSAPVSPLALVAGKLLVPVALVPVQVALWLILFAVNGFPAAAPLAVLATATLLGVLLTASGTLTAVWVREENATQAVYALVVLLQGAFSLLLPRDPLNLVALVASGTPDAAANLTILLIAAAAAVVGAAAVAVTHRQLRRDLL